VNDTEKLPPQDALASSRLDRSASNRLLPAVLLLVVWGMSSGFMGFIALFSVNERVLTIAATIAAISLVVAILLLVARRYAAAFSCAAVPGLLTFALLAIAFVRNG